MLIVCLIPCIDSWQLPLLQELAVAVPRRYGHSRFARAAHCWLLFRTRYWWKTGRTLPTLHWFYCCFWAMIGCRRCVVSIGRKKTRGRTRRIRKVRISEFVKCGEREERKGKLIIENKGEERQTKKQKDKRCSTYRCNNARKNA